MDENFENVLVEQKKGSEFRYLTIGRLDQNKNQQLIIRAFSQVIKKGIPATLRIGGSGTEIEHLKELAKKEGVEEKVFFLGHLSHDQVLREMISGNVFCLTSIYETFGVVVIEALACGMPVIVTPCGGPPELVNNENGLVALSNSVEDMTSAMVQLYHNMNSYNSEKIRQACLEKFGGPKVAGQLVDIYHSVLKKNAFARTNNH